MRTSDHALRTPPVAFSSSASPPLVRPDVLKPKLDDKFLEGEGLYLVKKPIPLQAISGCAEQWGYVPLYDISEARSHSLNI